MKRASTKNDSRRLRQNRIRAKISGTKERPRLSIYRSNVGMYAQLIDDTIGKTLLSANDKMLDAKDQKKSKLERAKLIGAAIASLAKTKGISTVVFDRAGFKYTGRVRALADGAREGGLAF